MTKQNLLVLMLETYFNFYKKLILGLFLFFIIFLTANAQESNNSNTTVNFPAAVIDMKKVLSKSTAFSSLQKEIQEVERNFKGEIEKEELALKKEQDNLIAQKSVLSEEEFIQKENLFKQKVNNIQSKVEKIRRDLEGAMARGMQIIQQEAVKHMKEISIKEGYLLVFDANSTVIAADKINISDLVSEKLNKSLPKISIEKKKEKKIE